jgi:hypothetical protein
MAGRFPAGVVHLLAINDGPLLAWLEQAEETWLTQQLGAALDDDPSQSVDARIRFIDLNKRLNLPRFGGHLS